MDPPPCEKCPVPRTRCVRFGSNNSSRPLTSSFDLQHFMTLSSAVQLLSLQLPFALIGSDRSERDEDEGEERGEAAGMRWDAGLIWDGISFYHGYSYCGPRHFCSVQPYFLYTRNMHTVYRIHTHSSFACHKELGYCHGRTLS